MKVDVAIETYYTVEQVAAQLAVSKDTARRMFLNEPGVMAIGKPFSKYRRSYHTLRIPQSVLTRVYARLTVKAA